MCSRIVVRNFAILFMALGLPGCKTSPAPDQRGQADADGFIASLEKQEVAQNVSDVLPALGQNGITMPVSHATWRAILTKSLQHDWKAKHDLLLLSEHLGDSYLWDAFVVYGGRTDTFTSSDLLELLVNHQPQDPKTAEFSLDLFVATLPDSKWPAEFHFEGAEPFDAVEISLQKIWGLPDRLMGRENRTTAVSWAQTAIRDRGKWEFDETKKTWSVGG